MSARPARAKPLSRDERRAVIVDATLPLLIEHGASVNSKQIAEAAGVAVGTIYSVFEDKDELVSACIRHFFDPERAVADVTALSGAGSLENLVDGLIAATQARTRGTFALLALLDKGGEGAAERHGVRPDDASLLDACERLFLSFSDRLRLPARRAAQVTRSAAFAYGNPMLSGGEPLAPREIRDVVLHGLASAPPSGEKDAR